MGENLKVTVELVPKAVAAVDEAVGLTGLSRIDVINRAVQLYAFVELEKSAGAQILVRSASGETHQMELL